MHELEFHDYIKTLKNGTIRENDLECKFIPKGISITKNLVISKKNNTCIDIIFKEKKSNNKRPFILFLPGYSGSNHNSQFYPHGSYFAKKYNAICAGLIFKSFNEYPFPEGLLDAIRVIKWVNDNIEKYNINKDELYVIGGYVGGSIASILATLKENNKFKINEKMPLSINSIVCLGAPYNFKTCLMECEQKNRLTTYLGNENITEDENKFISPIFHIHSNMSKILITAGNCDKLVPVSNAEIMYKNILECGAEANIKKYEKAGHGWFNKSPYLYEIIELIEDYFFYQTK